MAELDNPVSTDEWHMPLHIHQKHHLTCTSMCLTAVLRASCFGGGLQAPCKFHQGLTVQLVFAVLETTRPPKAHLGQLCIAAGKLPSAEGYIFPQLVLKQSKICRAGLAPAFLGTRAGWRLAKVATGGEKEAHFPVPPVSCADHL